MSSVVTDGISSGYSSDGTDSDLDDEILHAIDSEQDVDSGSEHNHSRNGSGGRSGSARANSLGTGSNSGEDGGDEDDTDSDDGGNALLRSPGDSECADDEGA